MFLAAASSTAGIITAVTTLVVAVTALLAGIPACIAAFRSLQKTRQVVEEVKTIVNGQSDKQRAHIATLTGTLVEHGLPVPPEPLSPPK